MRNTNLTVEDIREAIGKKEKAEMVKENKSLLLAQYLRDDKLVKKYLNDRITYIDQVSKDKLKTLIDEKISEKFEKNFKQTYTNISEACKEIQSIEKKKTWLKLRKWLFFNRIMEYRTK